MECRVLGPLEVTVAGVGVPLGGTKQRALLGLLVAARGRVVSVSRLIDELWSEAPPAKVLTSLQSYVANLRRALEPGRPARAQARILVTKPPGYALLMPSEVDAAAFERLAAEAHDLVDSRPQRARDLLAEAGRYWRGEAYADVAAATPGLAAEASRLAELRLLAAEDRWRAELALGGDALLVGEIESHLAAYPLREQAWGLLAVTLYRAQRQGDALAALRRARAVLAESLGVDPGPELRRIEQAVLTQQPFPLSPAAVSGTETRTEPAPPEHTEGPLVGRDEPLSRLTGCLVDAAAGRGSVVLVTGEPGIGKTEVARSLAETAKAMRLRIGWGSCQETGGAPAMWPWSEMFGTLLAGIGAEELRTALGGTAPALGALVPDLADGTSNPTTSDVDSAVFRLAEACTALLRDVTGPALLVLDDVHWADVDTLRLLRRLGQAIARLPVVLLLTLRNTEVTEHPALTEALAGLARTVPVRVHLSGLTPADVAVYLRRRHGAEVSADVVRSLHARTGGNPFFLGELVRLVDEERRRTGPEAADAQVPDGVRDVVRRRLAQLPEGVEPLLVTAAVSGHRFDLDVIAAATDLDDDAAMAAVEAALLAGLLTQDSPGSQRFTHALVREAIAARVPSARRRAIHGRLAEAIEQVTPSALDERLAELTYHHSNAGPSHARATWTCALRAAERAGAQPAPAEAARLHEVALAAVARDPQATEQDQHDVLIGLALARRRAGQERQAWAAARQAAELALARGDAVAAAKAAVAVSADAIWNWRGYQVVDGAAIDLLERVLERLPDSHDVLRAQLLSTLAVEIYYAPNTTQRAERLTTEALDITRANGSVSELARVLELRHVALERPELLAERLATAAELVRLAEGGLDQAARARALMFRGRDLIEQGKVTAGLADYRRAKDLAETHAIAPVRVAIAWAEAIMLIARGSFDAAQRAITEASALHASTTLAGGNEVPIVVHATLHLAQGTLPAIAPWLAEIAEATGLTLIRDWHALALVHGGCTDQARAVLGPWDEQPDVAHDYMALIHLAIRAQLWATLAPPSAIDALRATLRPYADRVAIGGTGIAFAGFLGHGVGLLAAAAGDSDTAAHAFTEALRHNESAGFVPFATANATALASHVR